MGEPRCVGVGVAPTNRGIGSDSSERPVATLRRQAAQGVLWSAAGNWGYQFTTLGVFVLLSRLLTPEAFGVVALASVFITLTKLIAEQGMTDALVQRPELEPEHLYTAFWANVGMGSVLAVLLASTSWLVAALVNEPEVAPVLAWLSLTLILSALGSVQRAILTRDLRFASLTVRTLSSVIVGGIVGVVAALRGLGVWSLVLQILTMDAVGLIAVWGASEWRPRWRFSRRHFGELFSFSRHIMGFRFLRFFNTRIDNLMVGAVLGATALGFYVVAYRLFELMINVTTSIIGGVAFPVFSRIQDDRRRVRSAYYKSIGLTSVLAFPAFLGLFVVAPEMTRLVFGSQWQASVPVMRVLALGGVGVSILFVNGIVMKSLGKPSLRLTIMSLTAVALLVAFSIAVHWGIVAVATAFVLVTYLFAPAWLLGTRKLIGLSGARYLKQIGPPLLASVAMMVGVFGLKLLIGEVALVWRVLLLVTFGIVIYGAALWLVGRPLAREALQMIRLVFPRQAAGTP